MRNILAPLRDSFRDATSSASATAERVADATHDRLMDALGKSERQLHVLRRHALDSANDAVQEAKSAVVPYRRRMERLYADAMAYADTLRGGLRDKAHGLVDTARAAAPRAEILRNRYVLLSLAAGTCYLVVHQLRKRRQKAKAANKAPRAAARKSARATNGQRKPRAGARTNAHAE